MLDDEDNREEGELSEEGELPEEAPAEAVPSEQEAQQTQSEPAQATESAQAVPAGPSQPHEEQHEQQQQQQQQAAPPRGRSEAHRRDAPPAQERERREEHHGRGGGEFDRHREHDKFRSERERAEIAQELDRLTYDLSFQEVRSNWVVACQDLRTAIKKLDKLLRRVKKKREDDVELYPSCYNYSTRICNALKHVIVICSTGLGKMADMELANALMRTAVNYRHEVFSLTQKRELEQQIRDSKEFRHLFTDRDRGRSSSKANGAAPGGAAAAGAGSARPEGEQAGQRLPLQRGQQQQGQQQAPLSGRSDGVQTSASKDEAVSEASHAAAGATSSRGPLGGSGTAAAAAAAAAAGLEQVPPSPPGSVSAARSGGAPAAAGPSSSGALGAAAADGSAGAADAQARPSYSGSRGNAAAGGGIGGGMSSSRGPGGQQQQAGGGGGGAGGGSSRGPIRIVLNSTSVAADGGGGGGGGAGGSSSAGLKRPMPQIQDLDAEEEDEQAAKRARQDVGGPGGSALHHSGAGAAANGMPLSELPEVVAAMNNPSQLQMVLQSLLGSHRLCLVLDLDHTLVNSAKFAEVDADWEYKLEQLAAEQLSRPKEGRDLHRLARVSMWTKLRPGVREFMRRAAERFELWIYTAGSKAYADAMVELLDPSGVYFGGRVIAQGAPSGPDDAPAEALVFKRLMQGLEGREPVVVIVDDSSAVWPHDRRNLFVVERYIYFPSSRKRFGMQGKSLLEIDRDECPSRGMLMTALRIFEHLHDLVFARMRTAPPAASPEAAAVWDVRNVMAAEKRQVLQGVHLVFSRVIPLESNPRQHPLWQLAEQFGATCGDQCSDTTTHVVATHGGTEKVMWARQNNRHVVSPAWLECSCILWQRANEERFPTPNS